MESGSFSSETSTTISKSSPTTQELRRQRQILIGVIVAIVLLVVLVVTAIVYLLQPATPTDRIRDIFIIFMALESLVLGLVLVILIAQLARLINLLQNEIKPILDSTNETVSTLRGTTAFLSDNLVEPVIKMNEYFAGIQHALKVIGLARGKKE
jgi:predicted tellurium resistance membrane protein TerC